MAESARQALLKGVPDGAPEGRTQIRDPPTPSESPTFVPPEFHDPESLLLQILALLSAEELEEFKRKLRDSDAVSEAQLEAAASVPELCHLLLDSYGGSGAVETAGRVLYAIGLHRQSDGLRLAAMGFSPERCLDFALENLEAEELQLFKSKLRSLPSSQAIGKARLEASNVCQLRELLVGTYGRFVALEVSDQVLKAIGLSQQADWLRLAVVRFSPRKCLDYALDSLAEEDLDRLKLTLPELCRRKTPTLVFEGEQKRANVLERRDWLEKADAHQISWRLMSRYGEDEALEVAAQALEAVQQKWQAEWLRRYMEERIPWKQLEGTLSVLGEENLEKFKRKLQDLMEQKGMVRTEPQLKGTSARELSKVMVRLYGREDALEVAYKVLKALDCESLADRLSSRSRRDWDQNLLDIFGNDLPQLGSSVFEEKERNREMENSEDFGEGGMCSRCSSESFSEKFKPDVVWDSQRRCEIYKFCSTTAGSFHCCYTDLIFKMRGAATITYQFDSWKKHQNVLDTQNLMVAGPLFDIQADPVEAVAAIHFPHFLCLADEDGSQVQVAHFLEEGMSLETPDAVGPFHAEVKNPRFSQRGTIFRKPWFKQKIKVHAVALLYQELEIATPKFHLYLLPNDSSLKKITLGDPLTRTTSYALHPLLMYLINVGDNFITVMPVGWSVHECELGCPSQRVSKPPGILKPLKIGSHFFVQELDQVKICPKELKLQYLDADMEQQYFEIYAQHIQDELALQVIEKNKDELVWEASVRRGELKFQVLNPVEGACGSRRISSTSSYASSGTNESPSPESHFIERHRKQLIQRTANVEGILDVLLQESILDDEQYQKISSKGTNQEKMRELYGLVPSWNNFCKDQLYEVLKAKQRFLIDDLEEK